jgi:hypothetical protein
MLIRKLEEERRLGKRRCRFEDNVKMDLRVIGYESVDLFHVALVRVQ